MMNMGYEIVVMSVEVECLIALGKNQKDQFIIYMLTRLEKTFFNYAVHLFLRGFY